MANQEHESDTSEVAPKMDPNDPRLRIRPRVGRTLRKGPVIAILFAVCGVVAASLVFAMEPQRKRLRDDPQTQIGTRKPIVPESILHASESMPAAPPTPQIGPALEAPPPAAPIEAPEPELEEKQEAREVGGARNSPFSAAALRRKSLEAYWAARGAPVLFQVNEVDPPAELEADGASLDGAELEPLGAGRDVRTGISAPSTASAGDDPNFQERKNAFLARSGQDDDAYLSSALQRPRSPYEVKAGSIVPAVLLTAINSDLPGPVIAQVRENVYDTVTGQYLLIPQGSRVLASYDSMVAWGQERVLLCWNRLVFPNGNSIQLQCMPAADLAGAAGLADEVDEHWWRIIKGAAIASLLAASAQYVAGNTDGYNPTIPQTWARNASGEINSVGQMLTRRNLQIQPTITVRPGFSVNVMVTRDMILEPYRQ